MRFFYITSLLLVFFATSTASAVGNRCYGPSDCTNGEKCVTHDNGTSWWCEKPSPTFDTTTTEFTEGDDVLKKEGISSVSSSSSISSAAPPPVVTLPPPPKPVVTPKPTPQPKPIVSSASSQSSSAQPEPEPKEETIANQLIDAVLDSGDTVHNIVYHNGVTTFEYQPQTKAKLFGFIPKNYNLIVTVTDNGGMNVRKPWWLFLASDDVDQHVEKLRNLLADLTLTSA